MKIFTGSALRKLAAAGVTAFFTFAITAPAYSHHSFAMYDMTSETTVTGKLIRFIPGANHAQILFTLIDEQGNTVVDETGVDVVWGVEMGPAARISREGVTVENFPVGTVVTATLHPLRDGRNFGALADPGIIKCGTELPAGGCNAETGESFLGQ